MFLELDISEKDNKRDSVPPRTDRVFRSKNNPLKLFYKPIASTREVFWWFSYWFCDFLSRVIKYNLIKKSNV